MQQEARNEWVLHARIKVSRLASEAEGARAFTLEVQQETYKYIAKIKELRDAEKRLTENQAFFLRTAPRAPDEIAKVDRELPILRKEIDFYEKALVDTRTQYAVAQQTAGAKGELARAARDALNRIEGAPSGVGGFVINGSGN